MSPQRLVPCFSHPTDSCDFYQVLGPYLRGLICAFPYAVATPEVFDPISRLSCEQYTHCHLSLRNLSCGKIFCFRYFYNPRCLSLPVPSHIIESKTFYILTTDLKVTFCSWKHIFIVHNMFGWLMSILKGVMEGINVGNYYPKITPCQLKISKVSGVILGIFDLKNLCQIRIMNCMYYIWNIVKYLELLSYCGLKWFVVLRIDIKKPPCTLLLHTNKLKIKTSMSCTKFISTLK